MDFLNPVFELFGTVLAFFYSLVPNLGVSIILLTFTIMLLLYPLTAKQAKSMIAMQRVQPEIKKLQAKYKGDRQKLNEEMMKFYQENKINPLAGCLPLLVQLPIFFALFRVLRDSYKYVPTDSDLYKALCGGFPAKGPGACGADLTLKVKEASPVLYKGIDVGSQIVHHLKFLGMDLQKSAVDAHDGFMSAAPYFLLVGLVILTGFLQTRQAQKRTPVANKQMGMVMRILPIFFGLISLQFPSGLVLYFFVSNLWRLGQQEVIFRRFGSATTTGRKEAIDVASKDRTGGKTATAVKELDAAEDDDVLDVDEATPPKPPPSRARSGPPAGGGPAKSEPSATSPTSTGAKPKGLRGMFALPPPPEGNGGGSTAKGKSTPPSRSSTPSSPPPQRRRSNKKKKRKR